MKFENSLNDIHSSSLPSIEDKKIVTRYRPDIPLFLEGNISFGVYRIMSGFIKKTKYTHEGEEVIINVLGPGEIIGIDSIFFKNKYSYNAYTITSCVFEFIESEKLIQKIENNKMFRESIIKSLLMKNSEIESRLIILSQRDLKRRVVMFFESFSKSICEKSKQKSISLLSRKDMSSMLNIANETFSRTLKELSDKNIIFKSGRLIFEKNSNSFRKFLET